MRKQKLFAVALVFLLMLGSVAYAGEAVTEFSSGLVWGMTVEELPEAYAEPGSGVPDPNTGDTAYTYETDIIPGYDETTKLFFSEETGLYKLFFVLTPEGDGVFPGDLAAQFAERFGEGVEVELAGNPLEDGYIWATENSLITLRFPLESDVFMARQLVCTALDRLDEEQTAEYALYTDAMGSPETGEITVYIGETGTKYHLQDCSTLRNGAFPISLSDALAEGREPCKICDPGV